MKGFIRKALIFLLFTPWMGFCAQHFEKNAPPSLADHLHLQRSKDPIDGGWLPNLTGLPTEEQAYISQKMLNVMMEDKDSKCTSVDLRLRMMFFQHFVNYQHMANAQNIYFDEKIAHKWAHVLAMTLKESSGDSANITDMQGHSISTYQPKTNLDQWMKILALTHNTQVKLNYQTNFGLTQTSADRLLVAFSLAADQKYSTSFLEGRKGAEIPRKIDLNTAIAIRRLIWFYQDFAQGRLNDSETRIHQRDINKKEFVERYRKGIDLALLYCGTRYMFQEGYDKSGESEMEKLRQSMASIAYCKLGNAEQGYGKNEINQKCYAQWVTLCPNLNIDIATLTPLSYFATRSEKAVCENVFTKLINRA